MVVTASITAKHTHIHNHFTALWILTRTTWVSRYQKKYSPTHTYPDHQLSFICFHLLWSMASSLFNLHAWQSFCAISVQAWIIKIIFATWCPYLLYIFHSSLGSCTCKSVSPIPHLDQFSHFSAANLCDQHIDRDKWRNAQTTLYKNSHERDWGHLPTLTLTSDIIVNVSSTLTNITIWFVAALCFTVDVRTYRCTYGWMDIFTRFIRSSLRRWPKNMHRNSWYITLLAVLAIWTNNNRNNNDNKTFEKLQHKMLPCWPDAMAVCSL